MEEVLQELALHNGVSWMPMRTEVGRTRSLTDLWENLGVEFDAVLAAGRVPDWTTMGVVCCG